MSASGQEHSRVKRYEVTLRVVCRVRAQSPAVAEALALETALGQRDAFDSGLRVVSALSLDCAEADE